MRKYICILIISLTSVIPVFAHSDFILSDSFGNVRTSIITGFRYEKINKVAIFGQLAEKLSKEMNYNGLIHLVFDHNYVLFDCAPASRISYERIRYWDNSAGWQTRRGIVITQFAKQFQAETTLKLVEYAISNHRNIRRTQERNRETGIRTINTSRIEKILNSPNNSVLNYIMQQKIDRPERPEENFREGISYFWQNNRYHIFLKDWRGDRSVLFEVDNIFDFHRFSRWYAVVFDTDSSFYVVNARFPDLNRGSMNWEPKISPRQVIEDSPGWQRPFRVHNIGRNKFSIHFEHHRQRGSGSISRYFTPGSRTLIYWLEEDLLIQNLGELLWENRVVETEEK